MMIEYLGDSDAVLLAEQHIQAKEDTMMCTFDEMVIIAEALHEWASNGSGTRGHDVSVWYGDDRDSYVVDYNDNVPMRVQRVGSTETWHAGE